jgi:two-component system sensor histidine kinase KdpD
MAVELTEPSTGVILAATAHELRLPVSHIKGFVSSLRRTDVTWDRQTKREFLEGIETEADRLDQLIETLLTETSEYAVIRGREIAESTTPVQIVESALHRARGVLSSHVLSVDVACNLPAVRLVRDGMERVIANLLQNAAKYSAPGTRISVAVRLTEQAELEFAVEDEGRGVPAEDRERIFLPWVRGQSDGPGSGLGLAIARSIVQAHGGNIQIMDAATGGARFVVRLPV